MLARRQRARRRSAFTDCVQTEDFTPLEPDALEHKFHAEGIGVVLEVDVESGERLELIEVVNA